MKLLYCQECGDIVSPQREANKPRWCRCGRHALWWVNPYSGILRVHDKQHRPSPDRKGSVYEYCPRMPRAFVLGMTNAFLAYPDENMSAGMIEQIIDSHPDYYLFKQQRSCVVRFRPGATSDTSWGALPIAEVPA